MGCCAGKPEGAELTTTNPSAAPASAKDAAEQASSACLVAHEADAAAEKSKQAAAAAAAAAEVEAAAKKAADEHAAELATLAKAAAAEEADAATAAAEAKAKEVPEHLERAKKKFDALDADSSGSLETAEINDLAKWVFESMHTDGEVMDTAAQDAEVAKLMELDTNKDANLSFDEFGEWCKTTMAAIYDTRSAAATAKRKDEAAAKAEAAAAAAEVQADATAAAAKVKAEDAAAKALAEAEAAAAAAKAKAEAAATTYASAYAEAAAASASAEEGVPMVRKYFTEEHERMLNRMVPPADADGNASADTSLDKLPTLADATAPATELSGVLFAQLLVGGFFNLYANLDRLNKENEFPIPDADTGTNMVICFKKAVRHLVEETAKAGPDCSLIAATEGFADDVVMNGQGNSGTILSHFFKTMADEVKALGKPSITCAELAAVLDATGAAMQKAVPTVFEGTMISCARDGTAGLGATKHESIQALCAAWTAKTSESCLATHTQLEKDGKKVLEGQQGLDGGPKVDSGASGFLMIVQGMSMACDGTITAEKMMDASEINPVGMISEAGVVIEEARGDLPEYPYQYCTECAIKLKPGTSEDEVKAFFENYQSEGNCDSMACVCTSTLAKLHVHTNDPGAVFKMAQEKFSIDEILLKEKVEDMFIERDQATQAPAYDMSKAKVHIMCDAAMLPYHELDHATILPAWVIDAIESRVLGDPRVNIFDVANANRHWLAEHGEPKKLDTAAPTPEQVELQFRKALDKCHNSQAEDILVLTISSMMSAMHRNVCTAAGQSADCEPLPDGGNCSLPEEARTRIHVYDTGYLGPNSLMAREAMRCAEKGMSLEEIMERVKHVENRVYSFFVVTSATKKKLAAWGRVYANLKGDKLKPEDVVDGEVCSHGTRPGPDGMAKGKIGEFVIGAPRLLPPAAPVPAQAMKAMNTFAPLATVPEGPDAVASLIAVEIEAIKANLSPGQKLMDVCVGTPIRQDISIAIGKQIKAALPVEGEVTVVDTLTIPALCQYGEMLISYWIEDGVDSNCTFNEFYAQGKSPPEVTMAMPGEGQEITPEWLSGVVNAPVVSCKSKAAAEGQTGVTFLVTEIEYGPDLAADHKAPKSLAVKMHALSAEGRGFAILAKFYEKELFFFENFKDEMAGLDFAIPKCYAMFKDSTPASDNPADPGTGCFNLVMEDLNTDYLPFSTTAGSTPTLDQHTVSMQAFKSMHTKFFEWSDPRFTSAPLSFSGGDFKWLDWAPLVGMLGQTWPAVKQYMPIFSGYLNPETKECKYETEHHFPPTWDKIIDLYDKLAANEAKGALAVLEGVNAKFSTRPQTIIHGDLNSGNFWVSKADPTKYLLADWQVVRMGPIGFDFFTMMCTTDAFHEPGSVETFLAEFHETLPDEVKAKYSLADLTEDLMLTSVTFSMGVCAVMAGQIAGYEAMPEDKRKGTWEEFWPNAFERVIALFEQLDDCYVYHEKLAGLQ